MITTTPALFTALTSIPVLAGTSAEAQKLLAEEGRVHDFETGACIVREGDEGHALFILVEGMVEVIKHAGTPNAVRLATLKQGSFFGEMCIVEPMPRAASVFAVSPTRVIEIRAATLHHLFQKMPEQYTIVLFNVARDLARRLRRLDEVFAACAT